jgi:hypothetical protein
VAGVLPAERPGLCPDEAESAKAIEVDRLTRSLTQVSAFDQTSPGQLGVAVLDLGGIAFDPGPLA